MMEAMAAPPMTVKLRCVSWSQLGAIYRKDLMRGGLFLKSKTPPPIGTEIRINLTLPSDSLIVLRGTVREHVPAARIRCRVSSDAQLEAAVNAGVGVSLMMCTLGDSHPDWRRIKLVPDLATPLWLLTHRDLRATVRMRAFRDYLAAVLVAKRDLIEGRRPLR